MKVDLNHKLTRGARRTLNAFSSVLLNLLQQEKFEKITVNQICTDACYPRTTFYNYFEDKYDLLNYCWFLIVSDIQINNTQHLTPEKAAHLYFGNLYDLLTERKDLLDKILLHNDIEGQMVQSFANYLKKEVNQIIGELESSLEHQVPKKLLVAYLSETVMVLLTWIFIDQHDLPKETAIDYLEQLLA